MINMAFTTQFATVEHVLAKVAMKAQSRDLLFHSVKDAKSPERTLEVDFLIRNGIKISPIEVKSARCREHVSLDRFIRKYDRRLGLRYVITAEGYFKENGIVYLPIYRAQFLARQKIAGHYNVFG